MLLRALGFLSSLTFLFHASQAWAHSFLMQRKHYRRPTCAPTESCLYIAMGYRFEFCDCPGENSHCPKEAENTVMHQGIAYHFCQRRELEECAVGNVATIVNKLQTQILCVCPQSMELRRVNDKETGITSYTCEKRVMCEEGDVCGIKDLAGLRKNCNCGPDRHCLFPPLSNYLEPSLGRCIQRPSTPAPPALNLTNLAAFL